MTITISALYTYPIKSCGGLAHQSLELVETGPRYDRHWVFTEPDGTFITQREYPRLALIQPRLGDTVLHISAPGMDEMRVPLAERPAAATQPVAVWRDTVPAVDEGDEISAWASDFLGVRVRLFHMPQSTVRRVDPNFAKAPAQVGFADGYPLLMISEASLADLNDKLVERGLAALTMASFRPNLVVGGVDGPFAEDGWSVVHTEQVAFDVVKPCARCAITTVDPQTGHIPNPREPLATLATYRQGQRGVEFGQNIVHRGGGTLRVGETVRVE
jgi:uncharacterized protein